MLDYLVIGQKIKILRKERKLSQEQLAEKVWISTTHMSHIETGSTKLSLPVLVDLAAALGVGTDEILSTHICSEKEDSLNDIQKLLRTCTPKQAKILLEVLKNTKEIMEKYE